MTGFRDEFTGDQPIGDLVVWFYSKRLLDFSKTERWLENNTRVYPFLSSTTWTPTLTEAVVPTASICRSHDDHAYYYGGPTLTATRVDLEMWELALYELKFRNTRFLQVR